MKITLKTVLIAIFFVYVLLSFLYALNGYPGFMQDSTCFLPTTYFINNYHQLINPLYDAGIDPIQHRFLFYPPLFPYTVAFIIRLLPNLENNILVALTLIDFFSIVLLFVSVYTFYKKNKLKPTVFSWLFLVAWMLSLFSFYGVSEGRPEVLSKLFIACFLLNNVRYREKRFYNFFDGLIIGLNLITSPISTFYLIVIKLGLYTYYSNFKLKPILQAIAGFAVVMVVFTLFYPYHIGELIAGMSKHSQNAIFNRVDPDTIKKFVSVYIISPYVPLSIGFFCMTICYVYYLLLKKKKALTLALLIVLTGMISFFSFKDMFMNYNLLVLAPIYFFLLFIIFSKINQKLFTFFNKTLFAILMMVLLINSVGFIRRTLLFFNSQDNKVSYSDYRKDFINVYNKIDKNKKITITFSLWPYCLDKFKNITMSYTDTSVQYRMIQQLYSGQSEPQNQDGFKVIKNKFITKHPKVGNIPLGNTYPWFQTAIYKRK